MNMLDFGKEEVEENAEENRKNPQSMRGKSTGTFSMEAVTEKMNDSGTLRTPTRNMCELTAKFPGSRPEAISKKSDAKQTDRRYTTAVVVFQRTFESIVPNDSPDSAINASKINYHRAFTVEKFAMSLIRGF